MKSLKPKITIGIPAYNEEANIYNLLECILSQKITKAHLEGILVISDGSADRTVDVARSIKDRRLLVIANKNRQGAMVIQNEILRKSDSDILIMLDADVLLKTKNFVDQIIEPILKDKNVGVVGADTISIPGVTFMEKVISTSHEFKREVFKRIKNGNNIYLCQGRARAFSSKFYKNFSWPNQSPEDAYSYLACIKSGYKFVYSKSAIVKYRSPGFLEDHKKQSDRFRRGKNNLLKQFDKKFVSAEYNIPLTVLIPVLIISIFKSPILMFSYLFIYLFLITNPPTKSINFTKWEIAESSKAIR